MTYLVSGLSVESVVTPQISISLADKQAIILTSIGMHSFPQILLQRDTENAQVIDQTLASLIEKFLTKI